MTLLFGALFRATLLVVVGYFISFAAQRAEGGVKTFGKYLALWTFVLAVLMLLGAAAAPMMGGRHMGMRGPGMMAPGMMGGAPGMMMRGPGMMQGPGMMREWMRMHRPFGPRAPGAAAPNAPGAAGTGGPTPPTNGATGGSTGGSTNGQAR